MELWGKKLNIASPSDESRRGDGVVLGVAAKVSWLLWLSSVSRTADRSLEQRCSPSVSQEVLFGTLRSLHTLAGRLNLREDVVKITIDWNELQSLSASSLLCSLGHSSNTFYIYSLF